MGLLPPPPNMLSPWYAASVNRRVFDTSSRILDELTRLTDYKFNEVVFRERVRNNAWLTNGSSFIRAASLSFACGAGANYVLNTATNRTRAMQLHRAILPDSENETDSNRLRCHVCATIFLNKKNANNRTAYAGHSLSVTSSASIDVTAKLLSSDSERELAISAPQTSAFS